ncbi:MAG: DMT family transporter [Ilumatobacteraceae bacterium]|nr:DMT family transporter [Ilumatobacteraceae bacterium]
MLTTNPRRRRFPRLSPRLSQTTATIVIGLTGVAYAFATFFARRLTDGGVSALTVAFARFALIAVVLAPWLALGRDDRRATLWGAASGAVMALGWVAYVEGIGSGDVALAGIAYMTYPLFTLAALALVFHHRPSGRQVAGGALVLAAAAVALFGAASGGGLPLITFLAPATFGASIAILTERLAGLRPAQRLASVAAGAVTALSPFVVSQPLEGALPKGAGQWAAILGLAIGAALVPMLCYATAAPVIGAARSAVAGATELPTVFIIGGLVFGERITTGHLVAAALVALAIVIMPSSRTAHVLPNQGSDDMDRTSASCVPASGPAPSRASATVRRAVSMSRPRRMSTQTAVVPARPIPAAQWTSNRSPDRSRSARPSTNSTVAANGMAPRSGIGHQIEWSPDSPIHAT